jgi:hypothetical protein
MSEVGRFLMTKQPHDIGAFRTMDLRNLFVTQPYFHDGSPKNHLGHGRSLQQGRGTESVPRWRNRPVGVKRTAGG